MTEIAVFNTKATLLFCSLNCCGQGSKKSHTSHKTCRKMAEAGKFASSQQDTAWGACITSASKKLPKACYAELQEATNQQPSHFHLVMAGSAKAFHVRCSGENRDTVRFQTQGSLFLYCVLKESKAVIYYSQHQAQSCDLKVIKEANTSNLIVLSAHLRKTA